MDSLNRIRAYRLGHDTEEACQLEAAAFTEDYRRMGEDPRLESGRERRMERIIMWIARVIPALRFSRMGVVMEQDQHIVSIVLFSRDGLKGPRWSIDAVGTHPDLQRRGMAKRLLERVFAIIRGYGGETCTLQVRQDNAVAYRMYQGLGFAHFHTSHQMKLGTGCYAGGSAAQVEGLERVEVSAWYDMWRERMGLAVRSTPTHVQEFKSVAENDFRRSWLIRALAPIAIKLGGFKLDQWIVRKEGELVATLRTRMDITGNRSHEIRLSIDPEWRSQLSAPLLQIACARLENAPSKGTLVEVGGEEEAILNALNAAGFEEMSVWHWLGVRVDRAMMGFEDERNKALTA